MRTAWLLLLTPMLGCFASSPSYSRGRYADTARPQAFEAYTTDGDSVIVEQDARTGNLYIVQPEQLRGERVAMVNSDVQGRALVTRDVRRQYQGSGGDQERRDERRREDDRRDPRDGDHR